MYEIQPVASAAQRRQWGLDPAAAAEIQSLAGQALAVGIQVDGLELAIALSDSESRARLRQALFNPAALATLRGKARRIEFITDGPLPPELLLEPPAKSVPIYRQVIDYALCKGCRLCIQVCPKHVYSDDGFGKPDERRHAEECTGNSQCAQCVYVCPERAISLDLANPLFESTLFIHLANPYQGQAADGAADFALANPLAVGEEFGVGPLPEELTAANRLLDAAGFHPILETRGVAQQFVDLPDPGATLAQWAREQGRREALVSRALTVLYRALPALEGLRQGSYDLGYILHRLVDELLLADIELDSPGGLGLLKAILEDGRLAQDYLGAKRRPIGGLLPPGTSVAWKTPYGNEVPVYSHLDKCLGPECGLCVTHCPEGSGGTTSAIRMVPLVPLAAMPALVRGLGAFLWKADGSHQALEDLEDLGRRQPFAFEVDTDYCKACGLCISCCPHDVIEAAPRTFDMGAAA